MTVQRRFRSRRGTYTVSPTDEHLLAHGDLADLYLGHGRGGTALFKIARGPEANDLLAAEAKILKRLNSDEAVEARFRPYLPELWESITPAGLVGGRESSSCQLNVFAYIANLHPLTTVRALYPEGILWDDAVWMFRRILVAIGFAHANGIVHGAVLPSHVLIEPTEHGLQLVDWTAAVSTGQAARLVSLPYEDWYPPEVAVGEPLTAATDIFLAAQSLSYLLGERGKAPSTQLEELIDSCLADQPDERPQQAWPLLEQLDQLIGPRRFRPFSLPFVEEQAQDNTKTTTSARSKRGAR